MARKGPPLGNKNAAGPHKKGYGVGIVSGAFGPVGSVAGGLYSGFTKDSVGNSKFRKASTLTGAALGGLGGTLQGAPFGPVGAALGGTAGAAFGAGFNYGGSRLGQALAKRKKR